MAEGHRETGIGPGPVVRLLIVDISQFGSPRAVACRRRALALDFRTAWIPARRDRTFGGTENPDAQEFGVETWSDVRYDGSRRG